MTFTPQQFAEDYIQRWEGGMSKDPNDAGNWSSGQKHVGTLLGSNCGVTGRALAQYRGVPVSSLTMADVQNIKLSEAAAIALKMYFREVNLHYLPWNRVTASVFDFGWGAGPVTSIKLFQRMLGANDDGKIGLLGETDTKFKNQLITRGEEALAKSWQAARNQYYTDLVARRPSDAKYINGWKNRSAYFTPNDKEGWWKRFGG
jgi:lysozyme family protein